MACHNDRVRVKLSDTYPWGECWMDYHKAIVVDNECIALSSELQHDKL